MTFGREHVIASPACVPCRSPASAAPKSWTSSTSPTRSPATASELYEISAAGVNFADTHQRES